MKQVKTMYRHMKYVAMLLIILPWMLHAQDPVQIQGVSTQEAGKPVKLFKVENGQPVQVAQTHLAQKGQFGFVFFPEYEGLYVIGTGDERSPIDMFKIWLKSGDQLHLEIEDNGYKLTDGPNTPENKVLNQWYQLTREMEQKGVYFMRNRSTYVDFFPVLESTLTQSEGWEKTHTTGNPTFDNQLRWLMDQDLALFATSMLSTPRVAHPDNDEIPEYYKTISVNDMFKHTQDVYRYPWGARAFRSRLLVDARLNGVAHKPGVEGYRETLKLIANDTLKGDYVLERLAGVTDYASFQELSKAFDAYMLTDLQKERRFQLLTPLLALKPGDPGYEFSYEDKDGKTVAFSDLRGKVVLVDVWATWCGPCKVEIPHLKQLEEEMKGTDLQIVSISVDVEKDKDKWKSMIKTENLGGMQLFASGWSDITGYYKITGIPRFMVFDREGKIVTIDSPRPSSPELKKLLEKVLAQS